ncbi:MAG TPA: hypothetical protein VGN07_07535 [Steroidobacteraceae bacterium]
MIETTTAMRETLQYLLGADIPAQHKKILIDALALAIRTVGDEDRRVQDLQKTGKEWQPQEAALLADLLRGKVAISWQQADEALMRVATQLHCAPDEVRRKANELGFGAGIDFRQAKKLRPLAQ